MRHINHNNNNDNNNNINSNSDNNKSTSNNDDNEILVSSSRNIRNGDGDYPMSSSANHNITEHNNNKNNSGNNVDESIVTTAVNIMISKFDILSKSQQLIILAGGVFVFFGLHNYLQEAIMKEPGFKFGVMLGYFEVLGVTICSYIERTYLSKTDKRRVAPLSAYPMLTLCLLSSSSFSNMSLNYINFPTKVVFRSCKLIPTMIIASIVHHKVFTSIEYVCAFSICMGLILFAAADWTLQDATFHPIGLILVSLSVCADALLPNAQERLFALGSSRSEVTYYTNVFTLAVMTVTTFLSGDLIGVLRQMTNYDNSASASTSSHLNKLLLAYTFIAYIAISFHMNVVKKFGGVTAVLVATARKGLTLVLSFLLFPKAFSWYYVFGAILVLGGLLVSSLIKSYNKKNSKNNNNNHTGTNSNNELSGSSKHEIGQIKRLNSGYDNNDDVMHRLERAEGRTHEDSMMANNKNRISDHLNNSTEEQDVEHFKSSPHVRRKFLAR